MAAEDIIKTNFSEYLEFAELAFKTGKFNVAVTLYYKALVELCDLTLLRTAGRIGSNHTERFDLLQVHRPELYRTASKLFNFYRDSYNKTISKAIAEQVKENVERAKKLVEG
jgi:hypothetical protein